jgi:hypothetical protein
MKKIFVIIAFGFLSAGSVLFAQRRRPVPPPPPPSRHYEIRPGPKRYELSKRIEQRRTELRREDRSRDRRRAEPRERGKR